jgi:hypothetical protein
MKKYGVFLGVVTALAGCGSNNSGPTNDGGVVATDAAMSDAAATDAPATTTDAPTAAADGLTCATAVNLNTAGTALASGVGVSFAGSNSDAADTLTAVPAPGCSDSGAVKLFSYTMQGANALVVSTESADTDFDTVVWVVDSCAAAATELGCGDDIGSSRASRAIAPNLAAGTTVTIAVGGYLDETVAKGSFHLEVSERPLLAAGAVCTADFPYCVAGSNCIADVGSSTMGHCVLDGTDNGACRETEPFCDTGLGCSSETPATVGGLCQPPIALGGVCTEQSFVCATGASCVFDSETMGHCVANGVQDGYCRLTAPFCDTGLTCSAATPAEGSRGECKVPVAIGGVCGSDDLCAATSSCVLDSGSETMGHCVVDGAEFGYCLDASPECAAGLTCGTNGLCQTPVALGGACTTDYHNLCAGDARCARETAAGVAGRCVAPGVHYGRCRLTAPFCDTGFECTVSTPSAGQTGICLPRLAAGASCDGLDWFCATGFSCPIAAAADTAVCTANGTVAYSDCRESAPPCDGTLECDPLYNLCLPSTP